MEIANICIDNIEFNYINNTFLKLKNPLNVKLNDIIIPFGLEEYNTNFYLTLEIDKKTSLLLKELENKIVEKSTNFIKELNKTVELENTIELSNINSFIKKENENTALIKFKIKKYKNRPIITISNNKSCFELPKNIKISNININIQGVWIFKDRCGLLSYINNINI